MISKAILENAAILAMASENISKKKTKPHRFDYNTTNRSHAETKKRKARRRMQSLSRAKNH